MALKNLAKMVAAVNREKTPEQEFLWMLEETIIRCAEEEKRKPSQAFHPSSLGGCLRRNFYELEGADTDIHTRPTANGVGMGESGTDRHERIQKYVTRMRKKGFDCDWIDVEEYLKMWPQQGSKVVERQGMEIKVYNSILAMSFKCDGVIRLNGILYVLEIKTEVSFKWMSRTEIVGKHKIQAACYSVALGIDNVMFLYENRDFCTKKTFAVSLTAQEKNELVVHRIEEVNGYREQKIIPPKTDIKSECKYCPFTEICKRDGVGA